MEDRSGVWDAKGVRPSGVDTLLGISTYDCPGGVHRSAKQSSPGLDPSRALRALFSTSRKGVTYRDTRESTEGLDISRRSAAVVAAWFPARFTAQERTTYGILVEVLSPSVSLSLSLSLSLSRSLFCPLLYICLLCLSLRSSTIFFSYRRSGSADVADLRRAKFGRRSFVFAVTSANFVNFLFFSLCEASSTLIFFFKQVRNIARETSRVDLERRESAKKGWYAYYFAVPRLLPT